MVKAAYSRGTPAPGIGAGNTPAVIDESANVKLAVNSIIHSKTFDNGMICLLNTSPSLSLSHMYVKHTTKIADVIDAMSLSFYNFTIIV